jgi:hypothetical protein
VYYFKTCFDILKTMPEKEIIKILDTEEKNDKERNNNK